MCVLKCVLLIAPKGIEILLHRLLKGSRKILLIAPKGIEILNPSKMASTS